MLGNEFLKEFYKNIYITHPARRFCSVASGFVLHMFLVPVNNTVYLKDLAAVA
jgi:hypothetical protein